MTEFLLKKSIKQHFAPCPPQYFWTLAFDGFVLSDKHCRRSHKHLQNSFMLLVDGTNFALCSISAHCFQQSWLFCYF